MTCFRDFQTLISNKPIEKLFSVFLIPLLSIGPVKCLHFLSPLTLALPTGCGTTLPCHSGFLFAKKTTQKTVSWHPAENWRRTQYIRQYFQNESSCIAYSIIFGASLGRKLHQVYKFFGRPWVKQYTNYRIIYTTQWMIITDKVQIPIRIWVFDFDWQSTNLRVIIITIVL